MENNENKNKKNWTNIKIKEWKWYLGRPMIRSQLNAGPYATLRAWYRKSPHTLPTLGPVSGLPMFWLGLVAYWLQRRALAWDCLGRPTIAADASTPRPEPPTPRLRTPPLHTRRRHRRSCSSSSGHRDSAVSTPSASLWWGFSYPAISFKSPRPSSRSDRKIDACESAHRLHRDLCIPAGIELALIHTCAAI
jgi:hypothetical protein